MTINSNNLDGIINLLNPKNDFYLIALLKDTGDGFTPEELSELKKKSTGELKPGAIHHYVLEGEIPKIDSTTLSAVKNRLNNLNHEKAVLMDFDRPDLIDKRDKEISFLSNYLSENLGLGCKIRSFPTSQSRLYNSESFELESRQKI